MAEMDQIERLKEIFGPKVEAEVADIPPRPVMGKTLPAVPRIIIWPEGKPCSSCGSVDCSDIDCE